ncbi:MAG: LTA synthase family protein, partial [Lachnospiraceae bacterium]|nr:LTA synthase family protein [Lachnospiraceae bacterium]
EGFSPHAVHKDLTPTLYKLVNTGYVFTNFYTPLWFGSTLAGEYANIVSQFPSNGGKISMEVTGENRTDMYYSLGRTMERAGYNLWGFHNNTATYYNRDESHPNMGYERWIAQGTGWEPEMNSSGSRPLWPQSDLHMIDTTFDLYVDQEPFHAYYLTVSAHAEYNFGGNAMAKRNQEAVANLPMSDEAKAYIACNIELDKAMESLIKKLEDAGIADRTLVVLTADHIPYGDAYKEALNEISAYQKGVSSYQIEQEYERYRNNLIIWTGSMKENVVVDKLCSSVDVLPTIYNMLGLEYESRVLAGRDIFSDSEGIVIFPNASYITDIARYSNKTLETTSLTGEELPEGYASSMVKSVRNRLKISRMFVEMDYYKYLH